MQNSKQESRSLSLAGPTRRGLRRLRQTGWAVSRRFVASQLRVRLSHDCPTLLLLCHNLGRAPTSGPGIRAPVRLCRALLLEADSSPERGRR
ncbi:hypothetical protein CEP54_006835 [Fusarium duplospermum]|uniref:Uncharacterized protein n=1 Tax=Fusarium duplospermum TaxID=1325734 RepID=A0A428Q4Z2_9HYPO|nr:hypothetical protein CEP54_006835 [Fusarium duplospermum]